MNLNLEPYRMPQPYPRVKSVRPEKLLTEMILDGYCGEVSELTTVLQYAHHSLHFQRRHPEIAQCMRGIFYVETIHMELLGELACKLGCDARYTLHLQENLIYWQASVVNYGRNVAEMLLADIEGEKKACSYYGELAAYTKQKELQFLFLRLAEDEKLHVRMLSDLYRRHFRKR